MGRQPTPEAPGAGDDPADRLLEALSRSQELGAIGPGSLDLHVAHAMGFLSVARRQGLPSGFRFLDLGAGGGLPGLVIAAQEPTASGVLLDGRTERARLLDGHVEALGWGSRLEVSGVRAELAGREPRLRGTFDLVVARGFGPPAVTAECGAPFLRVSGVLVVSEPPATARGRWPAMFLAALGLEPLGPVVTVDMPGRPAHYQVLRQVTTCPERWPRRVGIPAKRPLYSADPPTDC